MRARALRIEQLKEEAQAARYCAPLTIRGPGKTLTIKFWVGGFVAGGIGFRSNVDLYHAPTFRT